MNDYKGIDFLDKLYKNLYMSDEVQHTKENTDKRKEAIQKYMDRLERVHSKADTETKKRLIESLYYDKYVTKAEDITPEESRKIIIEGQKESLKLWIDYLNDVGSIYPTWAKYWTFQGMIKMGTYDELKEVYTKRDSKTIAPFVECNPEIVAQCIDTIVNIVYGRPLDEEIKKNIDKNSSFNKIYTYFEKKYKENVIEKSDSTDGIWIKYNQGSKEDAIKLCNSLKNKNTGWCTASNEQMAIKQLCGPYDSEKGGDFYVYYTMNKSGEYTIPRIAIRLKDSKELQQIAEIRGIEKGQNLEESMYEILENKLYLIRDEIVNRYATKENKENIEKIVNEDIEKNLNILKDLKELEELVVKTKNKEELTKEEINKLYRKKYGFGWINDSRALKIRKTRDLTKDINVLDYDARDKSIIVINSFSDYSVTDKNIVLSFFDRFGSAGPQFMNYAADNVRDDLEVIFKIADAENIKLSIITKSKKDVRNIILDIVDKKGSFLQYVSSRFQNDEEVVIRAIKQDLESFKYASDELKDNKKVISCAIKKYDIKLNKEVIEKENIRDIILDIVKVKGGYLEFASKKFQDDYEIVLTAVSNNGIALEFASERLKNDINIVKAAIKANASAIYDVGKDIKKDPIYKELLIEAVTKDSYAMHAIGYNLSIQDQKEIMSIVLKKFPKQAYFTYDRFKDMPEYEEAAIKLIREDPWNIEKLDKEIRNYPCYKNIVFEAVRLNGCILKSLPKDIKNEPYYKELAMEAVRQRSDALEDVIKDVPYYREIEKEAIKHDAYAIRYTSEEFKQDSEYDEIAIDAISRCPRAIEYVSENIQNHPKFKEVALKAVKDEGWLLGYVGKKLQDDEEVVLEAVREYGDAIRYASTRLRNNMQIVLEAIKQDPHAICYAGTDVRNKIKTRLEQLKQTIIKPVRKIKFKPNIKKKLGFRVKDKLDITEEENDIKIIK